MNTDRYPAVVRDRLQSKIPIGLIGETDLGLEVAGKQLELLQAGPFAVKKDRSGELALVGYSLEERSQVGPVGQEKGSEVDEDLAIVPHGRDGKRLGNRMAKGVGDGPGHGCARRGGKMGIHHPQLDPIAIPMKTDQVGS